MSKVLRVEYHLHYSWRPQSAEKVEKANDIIKRHLRKLTQETQDSRFKVLPIALMRAWTVPRRNCLYDRLFLHTGIVIYPEALESTMWLSFQLFNILINWRLPMVGFSTSGKGRSSTLRIPSPTTIICDALLDLMISNDPKMDWYNILYLNYEHNVTFNFDYVLIWFNYSFALHL